MLTCKITLPDSPHHYPVIIIKNPGFRALYLIIDRMNSVFFPLINTKKYFFSFLAAGFCPKNLSFDRKIMALPDSWGCRAPAPWLVRLCNVVDTLQVKSASAVLILANRCAVNEDDEDAANIMRATAIKNFREDTRIIIQLLQYRNKVVTYIIIIPEPWCFMHFVREHTARVSGYYLGLC